MCAFLELVLWKYIHFNVQLGLVYLNTTILMLFSYIYLQHILASLPLQMCLPTWERFNTKVKLNNGYSTWLKYCRPSARTNSRFHFLVYSTGEVNPLIYTSLTSELYISRYLDCVIYKSTNYIYTCVYLFLLISIQCTIYISLQFPTLSHIFIFHSPLIILPLPTNNSRPSLG